MSFLTEKTIGLTTLLGGGVVAATSSICKDGSIFKTQPCKRMQQKCYKLFSSVSEGGEIIVCPSTKEGENNPVFWLRWSQKGANKYYNPYTKVQKINTQVLDSNQGIKVQFTTDTGPKNREITMKLGYVSLFGTNKDTLNKLNEQELDKICKFQTDHIKRPKLNCGEYTQDLLHAQNYWILY